MFGVPCMPSYMTMLMMKDDYEAWDAMESQLNEEAEFIQKIFRCFSKQTYSAIIVTEELVWLLFKNPKAKLF